MVGGVFKRSLSFPNKALSRPPKPPISHHIRSISLPCRTHPLISHLKHEIRDLKTYASKPHPTSSWLYDLLTRLKNVHDSLDDILHLPQTHESLHRQQKPLIDQVLEDFLRFVDVYGIFQSSLLTLKEEQLAAHVAIRKRDVSKIGLYIKSRNKLAKEMTKLVSTIQSINIPSLPLPALDSDVELVSVIGDVIEVTMMVSVALFNGISSSFTTKKCSWIGLRLNKAKRVKVVEVGIEQLKQVGVERLWELKKKGEEEVKMLLKRMQDLDDCIGNIDNGSEKVFRSLINTRVSLLNTLAK